MQRSKRALDVDERERDDLQVVKHAKRTDNNTVLQIKDELHKKIRQVGVELDQLANFAHDQAEYQMNSKNVVISGLTTADLHGKTLMETALELISEHIVSKIPTDKQNEHHKLLFPHNKIVIPDISDIHPFSKPPTNHSSSGVVLFPRVIIQFTRKMVCSIIRENARLLADFNKVRKNGSPSKPPIIILDHHEFRFQHRFDYLRRLQKHLKQTMNLDSFVKHKRVKDPSIFIKHQEFRVDSIPRSYLTAFGPYRCTVNF